MSHPPPYAQTQKIQNMINSQLNLGLENIQPCPSVVRRERRLRRARLWFDHMRFIVDRAPEQLPKQNRRVETPMAASNQ